uniref:Kinesin-like protein n=1 Tax=Panagrolaimus sp. ES5 TaxID=591445 RepID=A0AC34FLJ3_9BILA
MIQENIKVYGRLRPFSTEKRTNQKASLQINPSNSTIIVENKNGVKTQYKLNGVFDAEKTQEAIYNIVGKPIVDGFIEGINGTIFAYGQTGSGKSYTMLGPDIDSESHVGIIPRAIKMIFSDLDSNAEANPNLFKYSIKCSFIEIYNENLIDLLESETKKLDIQTNGKLINIKNAAEMPVKSLDECLKYLKHGLKKRNIASTSMNDQSSRSHAIFMLTLESEELEGEKINKFSSRLNLVDLAGSERQSQTNNVGARLKETGKINNSLLTLARVIRKNAHYSIRDSKLTMILRDSIGGNSKTSVIVNIHQSPEFIGDTVLTLDFAASVKQVKNTVEVNRSVSCENIEVWKAENLRLRKENDELKAHVKNQTISDEEKKKWDELMSFCDEEEAKAQKGIKDCQNRQKELEAYLAIQLAESDSDSEYEY